ncbi:MAG TPA: HAD hydrolase-like protein, partial [Longimicrobiales bacterium]|nr:HAD hydrolase-like protein [Longimicrobiales bacterium]
MTGLGEPAGERSGHWAGVFFDLDGTLADTVPLILRCYRHTMRAHLGQELPDERWLRTIGTPLRDQLRAFARNADEAVAMLETYVAFQRSVHDEMVRPFDGARLVVEEV